MPFFGKRFFDDTGSTGQLNAIHVNSRSCGDGVGGIIRINAPKRSSFFKGNAQRSSGDASALKRFHCERARSTHLLMTSL